MMSMMNKLKFSANLSFLFAKETPHLTERYGLAKQYGFRCVEFAYPYSVPVKELVEAKNDAGVEQIIINSYPGNTEAGEFGFAAIPGKTKEFRDSLDLSIEYAQRLKCSKIHLMSGCYDDAYCHDEMEKTYLENLTFAADRLQKEGIQALIEPINAHFSIKNYFMKSPKNAFEYITKINHPNLKMMLDVYHLQILEGNLTMNIRKFWPVVGHIQIAQAPHRTEPMGLGEINFRYVLNLIRELNYDGYIGLEHNCTGPTTMDSLKWLQESGYEL
jgi:hydroxypyruvate isomerase